MDRKLRRSNFVSFALMLAVLMNTLSGKAIAAELITNGSFETGNFTGWTAVNAAGSWQNWAVVSNGFTTGFNSPASPPVGTRDAFQGIAANAGGVYTLSQDVTIPAASTASLTWRHRYQLDHNTFCNGAACGTATYAVQILNTSNVLLQTLYTTTTPPDTVVDTGWFSGIALLNQYAGQTIRIRFRTSVTATFAGPGSLEIDGVSVQSPAIPTSSSALIRGRASTATGVGIPHSVVTLTDQFGVTRRALTNGFGIYEFDNVAAGETYVVSITNKQHTFADPTRVVSVDDDVVDLDFVSLF